MWIPRVWAGLVTASIVWAGGLSAQQPIGPGSAVVRPAGGVQTDPVAYDLISVSDGVESLAASVVRQSRETEWQGLKAILFVQQYLAPDGRRTNVDSSWVSAEGLRPLAYVAVVGDEEQRLRFEGGGARGRITRPDTAWDVNDPGAVGAFLSVVEDLVMARLPLAHGATANLRLYNPGRGAATVALAVEGTDEVPTARGPTRAWRIRYEAGVTSWFWLDVETRRLLQSRTPLPGGAEFWRVRRDDVPAWRRARGGGQVARPATGPAPTPSGDRRLGP